MSGNTVTQPNSASCTPSRAARELGLKRGEFDLGVNLGHIRTVPDEGGGGLRVTRTEIDRLHAEDGFPGTLKQRVEAVGTKDGAELMAVPLGRFTRLARLGVVVPVRFYLNRYRAVVWLYLAEELRQFAADENNAPLLRGRTSAGLRQQLAEGLDLRPRTWRGRHLGFLRRRAGDHPWACAAAVASQLDAVQIAEIVQDPYERAHLNRFRPSPPAHGAPGSPAAHLAESLSMAQDPGEIGWLRADLAQAVDEARALQPAPRPTPGHGRPAPGPAPTEAREPTHPTLPTAAEQSPTESEEPGCSRGLLSRLLRRSA
ncbi:MULTISPECIES: DUF6397 family protein [unclassified Streptomyces]|uniref:DUF6397 family protein n=1 Tax=unclassified Streptomyces TaxID=2593676 RepID=UPI0022535860|nr:MULTISPECIES: DUF6397 family protein [unclassified Streptomyces]MCX4879009.1 DUF6397 family protein [Streptomyces sp. NBC_00847]MCX5418965.1 DUF6397 family protein [Streptomyces sp. NBC_00078]